MKNKFKVKRAVFIYVFLHSAVIAMLAILLARAGNPFLAIAAVTGALALTLYTTHTVVQSINDEITHREKALSKISANLQTAFAVLGECAKELEQRIAVISECGRELEHRANVINECSDKINILITMADLADGSSGRTADGVANKNV